MKILFVSSGNLKLRINPIIENQGVSLKALGINIDYFVIRGKGTRGYVKNIFILKRYLSNNKYDLIHAHYSLTAFVASLANIGKKAPIIVSLMGSDTESNQLEKILIKSFNKLFWSKLIMKSESMSSRLKINNTLIIPNAVDLNKIGCKYRKYINTEPLKVLFAANPNRKSKNFSLAKKAFSQINESTACLKLVYDVSHNIIIKELDEADVLLSTSLWEGSPNIIKEAMACNCPIVSTNVGDVNWLFGNTEGCYITSFEPSDVAAKLKLALKFAEENGRTNGRQRMLELGLDSVTVAKKLINIYKEVVENKN